MRVARMSASGGAALGFKRGGEEIYPEVIRVGDGLLAGVGGLELGLVAREAVGVEARVVLDGFEGNLVHVEGRVGEDVVEGAEALVRVVVVGVGLLDGAAEAVHREVHLGEVDGFEGLFLSADEDVVVAGLEVAAVLGDELGGLDKHAAGAAGRVEDAAAVGLDNLDHEADDGARGEEFAALLALAAGEFAEEVFVDLPKNVAGGVGRDVGKVAEEIVGDRLGFLVAGEAEIVVLGEDALELGFILLDGLHGGLEGLGDVLGLG